MKETNLMSSPRLIGRCCLKEYLYSKTTLMLLIFMLPLVGMAQQAISPQEKETENQAYLQKIQGNKTGELQQVSEIAGKTRDLSEAQKQQLLEEQEYQQLLVEYGIDEQKYLDHGFTKADILAEIGLQNQSNPSISNGMMSRSGGGDYCSDAVTLECGVPSDGDVFAAYASGAPICGSSPTDGTGVWYSFTGNGYMNYIDITATSILGGANIRVFSSGDGTCNTLQCASVSGQGSNSVSFLAPYEDTFYVLVSGFGPNKGTFTISRTSAGECIDGPSGDGLTAETGYTIDCGDFATGSTTGLPTTSGLPSCGDSVSTSPGVWYRFTAVAGSPEDINVSLCGSMFDTDLHVYEGSPDNLVCVVAEDDSYVCPSDTSTPVYDSYVSEVDFVADIDVTYYIYISGWGSSDYGEYTITLSCDGNVVTPPPSAPANDICEDATQLFCGDELTGQTTIAANLEVASDCSYGIGPDVWYYFEGTGNSTEVTVTPVSSSVQLEIYESYGSCSDFAIGSCYAYDSYGSSSGPAVVGFNTDANRSYFVRVGGSSSTYEDIDFTISLTCLDPILNDDCEDAIAIECGDIAMGSTTGATAQGLPGCSTSVSTAPGVWYSHIGTGEVLTISLAGSSYDTKLGLYSGTCDALTCIETDDDDGPGTTSEITYTTTLGEEYLIYVTGYSSNTGTYNLELTCQPDPCTNATDIACGDTATGTTVGASTIGPSSYCGTSAGTYGVFYRYIGTDDFVTASLCNSGYDTKIQVYQGDCSALTCVGGNDDSCGSRSEYQFFAAAGETFYIWVTGWSTSAGDYELTLTCDEPVANDLCEDALALSCDATISGSTELSTKRDAPTESCDGNTPQNGVWYTVTGTGGDIVASTCTGTDFDTQLMIYTGTCGDLTCLVSNDDACGSRSEVTFATMAGETYYVYVSGYGTQRGNYTLSIDCLCAPSSGATECVTIYDGYDPASTTTLTGNINYAEGSVSYLWSNGDTTQSTTVYAADGTQNYTVTMTDAEGCTVSEEFFVYVMDVNCDTRGTDKVEVCHNGTTICVAPSAIEAHLQHGDVLGTCGNSLCDEVTPYCDLTVTYPADGEIDTPADILIEWESGTGIIDGYTITIGTTSGGNDVVDALDLGDVLSYQTGELAYETTFYYTITPYNSNGSAIGCMEYTYTTVADPFPNDDCAGAIDLTVNGANDGCAVTFIADMSFATPSSDSYDSSCDGVGTNTDSWYTFTAPAGGTVIVSVTDITQGGTAEWALFTSCGGSQIDCGYNPSNETISGLTPGASYTLMIWYDTYSYTTMGTYEICLSEPQPAPANDLIGGAFAIACGDTVSGSTTFATDFDEVGTCGTTTGAAGLWYVLAGDGSAVTASTCGSSYDTKIQVWSGAPGSLSCVTGNDDSCGLQSTVNFTADAGTNYYIYVFGFGSSTGDFDLSLTCTPPLSGCVDNDLTVYIDTDTFGSETSWNITNSSNTIVASGSGYGGNTINTIPVNLPDGDYTFTIFDSWGDGIYSPSGYRLSDSNGVVIVEDFSNSFSSSAATDFCVGASSARIAADTKGSTNTALDWSMAPNPTKGNVTLDLTNYLQSNVTIDVMNVTGKVIYNTSLINLQGSKYNVELNNSLPAGMYFVRVAAGDQVSTKKLMIMR